MQAITQEYVAELQQKLDDARRARVKGELIKLVEARRMLAIEVPRALDRALADESYLDELRMRPELPQCVDVLVIPPRASELPPLNSCERLRHKQHAIAPR